MKRTKDQAREAKNERDRQRRLENVDAYRAAHRARYKAKQALPKVTAERLRELLHYDPRTGLFTYRVSRGRFAAGTAAGHQEKGSNRINIILDGRLYRAHRLAWLYITGEWPKLEIDHKDTDQSNNRWNNLRDVTSTVNKQNRRCAPSGKKYSPLLGAQWCIQRKKWKASIKVDGKVKHIGFFETDVAAAAAYLDAKRKFHEGCTL